MKIPTLNIQNLGQIKEASLSFGEVGRVMDLLEAQQDAFAVVSSKRT